jgi:hypothetical protein
MHGTLACGVLTVASSLLCLALLELPALLGFVDYRSVILPPIARLKPWEDPRYQIDKELLWIRRPNQRFVGRSSGDLVHWLGISSTRQYHFDVQSDSRGFRNNQDIQQAPVVVIGDSMVEWGFVPQAGLVSTQLSQRLQVQVANLGQPGYGPQQELVVLRRYGLALLPKIVLWFFFEGNDLLDVQRYESLMRNWDATAKELRGFRRRSFVMNALLVLKRAATAGRRRDNGDEARRRSCVFLRGQNEDQRTIYFAYENLPLSEKDESSLDVAQKVFLEAYKLSTHAGVKLLFVYIPTKFRVYRELCKFPDDGYGKKWQPNNLPDRLESQHKSAGITHLNLTESFKAAAGAGELVYFADDGHLNEKGHKVAAETIIKTLSRTGWLQLLGNNLAP